MARHDGMSLHFSICCVMNCMLYDYCLLFIVFFPVY